MSNRSPAIVPIETRNPDHVTTADLCAQLGLSPKKFGSMRQRGVWKIEPVRPAGRGRKGCDAIWSLAQAKATDPRPAIEALPEGPPPKELSRPDGRYISIEAAAADRARFSLENRIRKWIDRGCDLLPRTDKGERARMRGCEFEYRIPGILRRETHRYVHEGDLNTAIEERKRRGEKKYKTGLTLRQAWRAAGLGQRMFKRFVEDPEECRRLIGHPATPEILPAVSGHVVKAHRRWQKADMIEVRKALKREAAKYPNMIVEAEARRRFPALPTGRLKDFHEHCRFLPDGRGINYRENVLRRDANGNYDYHTVYDEKDLAAIEAENKLTIRDSRNRIVGRREEKAAQAMQDTSLHAKVDGLHHKFDRFGVRQERHGEKLRAIGHDVKATPARVAKRVTAEQPELPWPTQTTNGYTTAALLSLTGFSDNGTLNSYMRRADVTPAGRGKRNHQFSPEEAKRILAAVRDHCTQRANVESAKKALAEMPN